MITRLMLGVLALATFFVAGCNEGSPGEDANFAGSWGVRGTVTGGQQLPSGTEFHFAMSLSQSGTDVSGSFHTNSIGTGVSGSVSGRAMTFTFSQAVSCLGVFNGVATVDSSGWALDGRYSGSDCNGTLQASFVAHRDSYTLVSGGGIILDGSPP